MRLFRLEGTYQCPRMANLNKYIFTAFSHKQKVNNLKLLSAHINFRHSICSFLLSEQTVKMIQCKSKLQNVILTFFIYSNFPFCCFFAHLMYGLTERHSIQGSPDLQPATIWSYSRSTLESSYDLDSMLRQLPLPFTWLNFRQLAIWPNLQPFAASCNHMNPFYNGIAENQHFWFSAKLCP